MATSAPMRTRRGWWSGLWALPVIARLAVPGRHVHGRVGRGARGRASCSSCRTGWAGGSSGRARGWRGSGGLPGHVARNGSGQSQSLRILGARRPARGAAPLRLGWDCPSPGRSTGTRRRWSSIVEGFCSASRRLRPLAPMRSNPLRYRGARSARALTVARGVGQGLSSPRPLWNPSTPDSWSRPWSCGRAEGPSTVRVSAGGRPRAGMSMGVWFAERVVVRRRVP